MGNNLEFFQAVLLILVFGGGVFWITKRTHRKMKKQRKENRRNIEEMVAAGKITAEEGEFILNGELY